MKRLLLSVALVAFFQLAATASARVKQVTFHADVVHAYVEFSHFSPSAVNLRDILVQNGAFQFAERNITSIRLCNVSEAAFLNFEVSTGHQCTVLTNRINSFSGAEQNWQLQFLGSPGVIEIHFAPINDPGRAIQSK